MIEKLKILYQDKGVSAVCLLICCLVFIFILPALELNLEILSTLLFVFIILIASSVINRKALIFGLSVGLIEIMVSTTDLIYLRYLSEITSNLFLIYVVASVIHHLLHQRKITIYSLVDALNGYLLLGIMFISLVSFCDFYFPGSYDIEGSSGMELIYYTMITLTTAGYGDITPKLPVAQSLSMFIAVTGQFYVAVIVAILVGKYTSLQGTST